MIASVGLQEKRKTRTRKLSGGQRRRLDVALGVIGNPELLFLDEPTTGFDPEARRQFWTLIENLRTEGTTILLTTHYLDEAEHLADRVGVIADGLMLEVATPDTLGGRGARTARVSWLDADGAHGDTHRQPDRGGRAADGPVRRRGTGAAGPPAQPGRHLPGTDRYARHTPAAAALEGAVR